MPDVQSRGVERERSDSRPGGIGYKRGDAEWPYQASFTSVTIVLVANRTY